jgi:hypothetical protein
MARPITLFTGQWADLPFEEVPRLASSWGYDGRHRDILPDEIWGDGLLVQRVLDAVECSSAARAQPTPVGRPAPSRTAC